MIPFGFFYPYWKKSLIATFTFWRSVYLLLISLKGLIFLLKHTVNLLKVFLPFSQNKFCTLQALCTHQKTLLHINSFTNNEDVTHHTLAKTLDQKDRLIVDWIQILFLQSYLIMISPFFVFDLNLCNKVFYDYRTWSYISSSTRNQTLRTK